MDNSGHGIVRGHDSRVTLRSGWRNQNKECIRHCINDRMESSRDIPYIQLRFEILIALERQKETNKEEKKEEKKEGKAALLFTISVNGFVAHDDMATLKQSLIILCH